MATPTYELIETTTLTSNASSVIFSSIPQDYRDLVFVAEIIDDETTSTAVPVFIFNSDTSANYNFVFMKNDGSSTASQSLTNRENMEIFDSVFPISGKALGVAQIMDYSATDKHKSVLFRGGSQSANSGPTVQAGAGRYASTNAITNINFYSVSPTREFAVGTTVSLYGIAS